jgi:hypothetical protein
LADAIVGSKERTMSGSSGSGPESERPAEPEPQAAKPIEKVKRDDEKLPEKLKDERLEKNEKLEKDAKEKPEKALKDEKLEKNEKLEKDAKDKPEKELKPEKLEKGEKEFKGDKLERKEFKEDKPEKFERKELKEDKLEGKDIKSEKPENEKLKPELEKPEPEKAKPEREKPPGTEGGRIPDPTTLPVDREGLLQHAEALEQAARRLRHFIEQGERPDLSQGALQNEPEGEEG